jgi:hypothetical protein
MGGVAGMPASRNHGGGSPLCDNEWPEIRVKPFIIRHYLCSQTP